ncbi:MAG: hypothetical protein IPF98_10995 [Gemmatimonadetes bacterium]|nr:hypothetical protein [Gemmatimonadota bacterium]MCC6770923.1 hypothetical protein [Gemmatimonadaceae bacterium]
MTRLRFLLTCAAALILFVSPAAAQQPANVTGTWAFSVTTANGTGTPTVVLKQDGEKLTGTYESPRLGVRELEGTVKGNDIRFALKGAGDGAPTLTFIGVVVDKDHMNGELDMGGMGSATFTGQRKP